MYEKRQQKSRQAPAKGAEKGVKPRRAPASRRESASHERSVSLSPLSLEDAIRSLVATQPDGKEPRSIREGHDDAE